MKTEELMVRRELDLLYPYHSSLLTCLIFSSSGVDQQEQAKMEWITMKDHRDYGVNAYIIVEHIGGVGIRSHKVITEIMG